MTRPGPKGFAEPALPDAKELLLARDELGKELAYRGKTFASPAEVLAGFAESVKQIPLPTTGRFGRFWHYDLAERWICCDAGNGHYELELDKIPKDIALHMAGKTWTDAEVLGDFVLLLSSVFRLRSWGDAPRIPGSKEPLTPA